MEFRLSARLFAGVVDPTVFQCRFYGKLVRVDVSGSNVQRLIYLFGRRFIAECHVVWHLCKPGSVVADVGANIGHYTLLFVPRVRPKDTVLLFDLDLGSPTELRRNVE